MAAKSASSNSTIRLAKEKDIFNLVRLSSSSFRSTFEEDNNKSDIDLYIEENFSAQQLKAQVLDRNNIFLLLFLAQPTVTLEEKTTTEPPSPIGYAKLRIGPAEACVTGESPIELERLYLEAATVGKGLGSRLMQACLDEANERGYQTVWLGVWEHNHRAIAFYRRWGFEIVGTHPFQQGTETQTDYVMQRAL